MNKNTEVGSYLSKEVFEVHIGYTKEALDDLKKTSSLICHKIEEHEKTLVRNTISLEEHKKRSLHIEERQDSVISIISDIKEAFGGFTVTLQHIDNRITLIESEITPIKKHIDEVKNITKVLNTLYQNKTLIVKVLVFISVIVFGAYMGINNLGDAIKVLK
jgi:hypothetical protein